MPASCRFAALLLTASLVTSAANAMDDFLAASSRAPTLIKLCGQDGPIKPELCQQQGYDALVTQLDRALQAALATAPANIRPLLKRDQAWFGEMAIEAADTMPLSEQSEDHETFAAMLGQRIKTLDEIAVAFGRAGLAGGWADAFGSVMLTPTDGGAYRLAIDTRAVYGIGSERRRQCKATALVKPAAAGWLTGALLPEDAGSTTERTVRRSPMPRHSLPTPRR